MKVYLTKFLLLILLAIGGCTVDLKTKDLVNEEMKYQSVSLIDNYLNFTYTENHGLAFGFLDRFNQNWRKPLVFLLSIASSAVFFLLAWKNRYQKFRLLLPIFIIIGGAYGNIIDRAVNGYVTDFIHLHYFDQYSFYIFNVADMLVNLGLILILLQLKEFRGLMDSLFRKEVKMKESR